jgi:DNA polymerase-1
MIRIPDTLREKKLDADMLLQVHDELLFEVPENQVDDTVAVVRGVMEAAAGPSLTLTVPLVVEAGIGDNWDEAH